GRDHRDVGLGLLLQSSAPPARPAAPALALMSAARELRGLIVRPRPTAPALDDAASRVLCARSSMAQEQDLQEIRRILARRRDDPTLAPLGALLHLHRGLPTPAPG